MSPSSRADRLARVFALVAIVGGGAGSLGLMLGAAHPPVTLLVIFTGWVLSPFVALALANSVSARFQAIPAAPRYGVMLGVVAVSLLTYGGIIPMPQPAPPAFSYLAVPLVSWMLIVLLLAFGRRSR